MNMISQETFDEVVLENMEISDVSLEEALKDTVTEFELQGVKLFGIVKNPTLSEDKQKLIHAVIKGLEIIEKYLENVVDEDDVCKALKIFITECQSSVAHRMLATNNDAYPKLLNLIEKSMMNDKVLAKSLQAMESLTITNSDILDKNGALIMIQLLTDWETTTKNADVPLHLAGWCLESCLKHENNRQNLVEAGVTGKMVKLLVGHRSDPKIVRMCLRAIRSFSLDDDVRAEFGKAHDHARILVEEHNMLKISLDLTKDYLDDSEVTGEILSTLTRLCVRAEYCQAAVDYGALMVINDILVSFSDDKSLCKQAIHLLKTICGNDRVKDEAMKIGASQLIIAALMKHQTNRAVCEACLGAISMLALRATAHAQTLGKEGALDSVVQAMKLHPDVEKIQVLGCMAVRNLGAKVAENRTGLIECQVEDVIHSAMNKFGDSIKDQAKAALRDLGLQVKLEEQWKGLGVQMQQ